MLIRPAIGDTDPIRSRRPTPDGQFSGNIIDEAMRGQICKPIDKRHLRHVLLAYMDYYNATRTHLSLNKDAPISRAAEAVGRILCRPILGGLHHQYARALF